MMIESQVRVTISSLRVVSTKNTLLKNDALGLEINRLKEISKLELNRGKFSNG